MSNEFVEELRLTAKDEASGTLGGLSERLSEYSRRLFDLSGLLGSLGSTLSFGALIKSGIEFNSTMETTRGGIAALILSSNEFRDSQGRLVTGQGAVNAAFSAASSVQSKLVEDAKRTAASYQDLVSAFQTAYGPATAAGVTNLDKLRQVTVGVSQAVTALGLDSRQLSQEIRAIFTGEQGPDNTLNRVLGITKQQLDAVRRSGGDVGDYLMTKLKPFIDAAAQASDNLAVRASNLKDSFQQLAGEVSKPIFDVLKSAVTQASGALGDAKERLMGMGATAARVLQDLLPLAQSLVGLGIVAFDAGLKFLEGLGPAVSILTNLANAAAYVIDQLGPLAPMVYLSVKAFASLTAVDALGKTSVAVRVLTAAVETMQTVTLAGAILTFGALAVVIATVVAGLYALKLAFDLHKETDAARQSYVTFGDTMISNLNRMSAAHPELRKQVELLKVDILKAQAEGGDAVERAAGKFQTAYNKIAKEARNAGDAVVFMAGKRTVDPAEEKALGRLADQYTKLTKGIEDQIRLLRTPEAQRPFEKLRESAARDIAEIKSKFESSGEAIRLRWSLLTLQLQEEARKVALAYKGIPVDVQTNVEAAAASIQRLPDTVLSFAVATGKKVKAQFTTLVTELGSLFQDEFFTLLSGKFDDLGDVGKNFADSLLQNMSRSLTEIIQKAITAQGELGKLGAAGQGTGIFAPAFGNSPGGIGASVAAGGYAGYQIGGAVGNGGEANQYLGAIFGAVGSLWGPIGTLIGSLVGALLGQLLVGPKDIQTMVGKNGIPETMLGAWQQAPQNFIGAASNLFQLGAPSDRAKLTASLYDKIQEFLGSNDFHVHAGSPEDFQFDMKQLFQTVLPREFLRLGFGQTGMGQPFPGIDIWGPNDPTKPSADGVHLFDPEAPISKMLLGLGVSVQKLGEIAGRINTSDPTKLLEWLGTFVGVITGFDDLSKKFRATTWDEFSRALDKNAAENTPLAQFTTSAQQIRDLGSELSLYTGDEQIKRAQELIQLGEQRYQAELQYMSQLKSLAEGISKSIADQVKGLNYGLLDDGGKTAFLNKEIQALYTLLQSEKDPAKVATLVQQIQQDIGLLGGLGGNAKNQTFVDWATQLLNSVNQFAQGAITNAGARVAETNFGLDKFFEDLKKQFTTGIGGLGDDVGDPEKEPRRGLGRLGVEASDAAFQTERLGKRSGEAAASLENATGWLDYFAARLSAAADRADAAFAGAGGGGGSGAIETLRRNPYAAARKTGR